eukprot:3804456-Prorocentrum_lima.AAC.1
MRPPSPAAPLLDRPYPVRPGAWGLGWPPMRNLVCSASPTAPERPEALTLRGQALREAGPDATGGGTGPRWQRALTLQLP